MDVIQTIESAAHSAFEAVEHPFRTIGDRLKAIAGHLAVFGGHPYAAPPLQDALTELHAVVVDLAQEVAELRVPCPCKPAPTSAMAGGVALVAAGDAGQASASTSAGPGDAAPAAASSDFVTLTGADLAEFNAWKAAKAGAASFAAPQA